MKAYVSVAGPDIISIGASDVAQDILKQMKELAEYKKYHVITIPDLAAINCLYANNTLLHCSPEELLNSARIFATKIDYPRIELKNREFCKVDRCLSCRCLLFTKKRIYSILSSNVPKSSELIPMTYSANSNGENEQHKTGNGKQ